MEVYITESVARKLREKHNVREFEVAQCFRNLNKRYALDSRAEHRTEPPTLWFIGKTDKGRTLKVVFVRLSKTEGILKSAYEPNEDEIRIYAIYVNQS